MYNVVTVTMCPNCYSADLVTTCHTYSPRFYTHLTATTLQSITTNHRIIHFIRSTEMANLSLDQCVFLFRSLET